MNLPAVLRLRHHQLQEFVPFASCGAYAFRATENSKSLHRDFSFCIPDEFGQIIQGVFAQMFHIDSSMISVLSMRAESVNAILIAFSATGSGLPVSTILGAQLK